MNDIANNIAKLQQRIRLEEKKNNRSVNSVQLLAVSKTQPEAAIRAAFAAGQRDFGENYLQEALAKIAALADLPIHWHYIGAIQSNKTRPIAEAFDWVHSLDRLKIAERLSVQRPPGKPPLACCLQVNIGAETGKGGVAPAEAETLAAAVSRLPGLRLRGLMAIPPATDDPAAQRRAFDELAVLFHGLRERLPQLDTLSMGMSGDMEAAIAAGATMVRIGTAIFGARQYNRAGQNPDR